MVPPRECLAGISTRTWRLPLGDGRVACPASGACDVERCLRCANFVGYVDGAVICSREWPEPMRPGRR